MWLGPDPPPGVKLNFIVFSLFLVFLGPSIEPEKVTPKSASTANPPKIDAKKWFLSKFIEK
jgi:hypothetical protein